MGCVNCGKKGTKTVPTSPTGNIPTGQVFWDGIDFTCSTDPSLDTVKNDNFNVVMLRVLNALCTTSCCVTTTTYTNLVTNINSGGLVPNTIYRFPYQTRHLIADTSAEYNDTTVNYDDGTAVKSSFTPDTEYLWVRALTNNSIHVEAYSESFPRDIIYYDYSLDKTEDGLVDRPGFITYREDPDNDVSAFFDWRNVLHRRFDMDLTDNTRDADYETALNNNAFSILNHEVFYGFAGAGNGGSIPAFTNFDNGGNADLGLVSTANTGGYRDFKTFVGYGEVLYKSPVAEAPRFRNIHIKKSDAVARVLGSASGSPITTTNAGTSGGLYPFFSNVVFFVRSAENVTIGQNATGITILGRAIREIKIGHNNENIIIGGMQSSPFYNVPTEPEQYGFNEHITIGDNNRNIMISDANRRITIGSGNVGIYSNKFGYDNTIGSYNTNIYFSFSNEMVVEDWCQNIRLTTSNNVNVGSQCKVVDVIGAQASGVPLIPFIPAVTKDIPDGFNNVLNATEQSNLELSVGNACENIFLAYVWGADIGSQCKNIFAHLSAALKIGMSNELCDIKNTFYLKVGEDNQHLEIANSTSSNIEDGVSNVKILNSGYVTISDGVSNSMVANGASTINIGKFNDQVFVTAGDVINTGEGCSVLNLRNCSGFKVGDNCVDVYADTANDSIVGNNCSTIVMNDIGITAKATFAGDLQLYNYDINEARTLSGRPYVNQGPPLASEFTTPLSVFISDPNAGNFSINNIIGNNCSDIVILASIKNKIGDNSFSIHIGESITLANDYPLSFTGGNVDPAGSTPAYTVPNVQALAVTGGANCSNNVIGSNCSDIEIRGVAKTNNEFGNLVTGVEAVPSFSFTNNKVLVDGLSVVLTASYDNKVYDKRSSDNERWEMTISTLGALPANGTKLA